MGEAVEIRPRDIDKVLVARCVVGHQVQTLVDDAVVADRLVIDVVALGPLAAVLAAARDLRVGSEEAARGLRNFASVDLDLQEDAAIKINTKPKHFKSPLL